MIFDSILSSIFKNNFTPLTFDIDYSFEVEIPETTDIFILNPYSKVSGSKKKGFCYLSLCEINQNHTGFTNLPSHLFIRKKTEWNSYVVDITGPEWETFIMNECDFILRNGFENIFIDTIDTVEWLCDYQPLKKQSYLNSVYRIVGNLKKNISGSIIVNRGISVYENIRQYIDGVLLESFFYKKINSVWHPLSEAEQSWIFSQVLKINSDRKNCLAIDYPPLDSITENRLKETAFKHRVSWIHKNENLTSLS